MSDHRFVLAADIGQANDYTALVLLHSYPVNETGKPPRHHDVVHIERFRDVPYPEQVKRIAKLYRDMVAARDAKYVNATGSLVVDATGVGKPVLDELKAAGLNPRGVLITAGDQVSRGAGVDRVPKKELATVLQLALQAKRLRIAGGLPLAPVLVKELEGFKVKISLSGHPTFGNDVGEWRIAAHDDLVLATAIAVWTLEYRKLTSLATLRRVAGML